MARGINKVILVEEYADGASIPLLAEKHQVSRSFVRDAVMGAGVIRSRAEGVRLAAAQGRLGQAFRGKRRTFTASHISALRASAMQRGQRTAKGISKKPNGYLEITRGAHKGRSQHRVVAESMIGRQLGRDEVVHHIDHDRSNNDPSNLVVMTLSEHTRLHRTGEI